MIRDGAMEDARGQTVHSLQMWSKKTPGMLFNRMYLTPAGRPLRAASEYFYPSVEHK